MSMADRLIWAGFPAILCVFCGPVPAILAPMNSRSYTGFSIVTLTIAASRQRGMDCAIDCEPK